MYYKQKNPHGGAAAEISLDFSANVNPLGMPKAAMDAARDALNRAHRYPDPFCTRLVKAISEYEGVPESYILCGNGAGELIYTYCSALRPRRAMETAPAFSEYSEALGLVGCHIIRYPLGMDLDFMLDPAFLPKLAEEKPEVLFLCNPNNPTGRRIDSGLLEEILSLCGHMGTRILLDECFLPLSLDGEGSMIAKLCEHPELCILRAFTKSFGMAGLRLGCVLSSDSALLQSMSRLQPPWNVSNVAQAAGIAALSDSAFLSKSRKLIVKEREYISSEMGAMGLWVCHSEANFILFRAADNLDIKMLSKGIAIRSCENFIGLGRGWYRAAVRQHHENDAFIKALREIVG
ncbi:MAG: aminotransferase class I/II-fold pyridoxal phosphate-dependent enzyme [Oscillospiraceae bacterium]|nr:aminotransferase class I/II-fold pyridoxal phosphate-dependent enzyme [Oscillospiraceae bacterium]